MPPWVLIVTVSCAVMASQTQPACQFANTKATANQAACARWRIGYEHAGGLVMHALVDWL